MGTAGEVKFMEKSFVECPEVAGKTVTRLRLCPSCGSASEALIEFTDGTSFSCSLTFQPIGKAALFQGGAGSPQVIQEYDF